MELVLYCHVIRGAMKWSLCFIYFGVPGLRSKVRPLLGLGPKCSSYRCLSMRASWQNSRWNLSTFRVLTLSWSWPHPPAGRLKWGDMEIRPVQVMARGDPSGWEVKRQQAQKPKVTSILTARASLTPLQVHAEPSAQAPLPSAPPVVSPPTPGRREGARLLPCPVPCSLPSPVRKTWTRKRQEWLLGELCPQTGCQIQHKMPTKEAGKGLSCLQLAEGTIRTDPTREGRAAQGSLFSYLSLPSLAKDTNSRSCLYVGTAHTSKQT